MNRIGKKIAFRYYGGSNYGAMRYLNVEKEDNNYIEGLELDANGDETGEYRKYFKSQVTSLSLHPLVDAEKDAIEKFVIDWPEYATVLLGKYNLRKNRQYVWDGGKIVEPLTHGKVSIDRNRKTLTIDVNGKKITLDPSKYSDLKHLV